MTELEDHELLVEYARDHSETAFEQLVRKYLDLVYSAAFRFTGNSHHAQEISQAVFLVLSRKAGQLSRKTVLSGWLYETARLTSANFVRSEVRRKRREQEAYMQSAQSVTESDPSVWDQISPLLDDGMGRLGEGERNLLILRFFQQRTAQEVAQTLGLSPEAAQKRTTRAVEKLRVFFAKRGVVLSAAGIISVVTPNFVQAAPAGLLGSVTSVAVKGAAAVGPAVALANTVVKIRAFSKLQLGIGIGAGMILAAALIKQFGVTILRPQFERTYSLKSDQVLKHLGKPFIPERENYYLKKASLIYRSGLQIGIYWTPGSMVFLQDDNGLHWSRLCSHIPGQTLGDVIKCLFGLGPQWIRGDTNLLQLPLEGDWVVRAQSPRDEVLKEFCAIVERETGHQIRIEPRTNQTEVLEAHGVIDPVATVGVNAEYPPHIAMSIDSHNFENCEGDAPASDFLNWLGNWLNLPIVSALPPAEERKRIAWKMTSHRRVESPQLSQEEWAEREVTNFQAQSSITLARENRPAQMWYLSEAGHSVP